jgi:hypothetical protein
MADDENTVFPIARYDAMCRAIAEAHAVDEVKDLRDKAAALQAYARMADNREAETQCAEIRIRAERRAAGTVDEAKGGRPKKTGATSEPVSTIRDLGITKKQASTWQLASGCAAGSVEALLARVTGARLSDPKPSGEMLRAAEQVLGDFLERFDPPGLGRVTRLIREAHGVIIGMLAEGHPRHWAARRAV